MKTKLFVLGIVCIFLLSGLATAKTMNNKIENSKNISFISHNNHFEYKFYKEFDGVNDIISSPSNDGIDLTFTDYFAWWSPDPEDDDLDYLSFFYWISNLGDDFNGSVEFDVYYTFYYSDGTEETGPPSRYIQSSLRHGTWFGSGRTMRRSERPLEIKLEIINITIDDTNYENNNVTSLVLPGVTITGIVTGKGLLGYKTPAEHVWMRCATDVEGFSEHWGAVNLGEVGYVLTIPKNPETGPFQYDLKIDLGFGIVKTYKTEPLDQNEYLKKDFEFFGIKYLNFLKDLQEFLFNLLFNI